MGGYIGVQPVPEATQTRQEFVATDGQTSFATTGYTPNFLDVYLNGVKLSPSDYTATNGSDIVLDVGAALDDEVSVLAFTPFTTADIPAAYTDVDVNTHLNYSTATSGQVLSFSGSDYSWVDAASGAGGAGGDEIFWENGQNVTTDYTITSGKNAMSAGPITINSGVTVTVGAGETWTVV